MKKVKTIEKKYHSWGYLFAHPHFDIRSGIARTSRIHDKDANSSKSKVHKKSEEYDSNDERACDEFEYSDEECNDEYNKGNKYDFPSALVAEKKLHWSNDYDLNIGYWYQ